MVLSKQSTTPRFWMRGLVPGVLIGIGLLHSFVGVSGGGKLLAEIAREGLWGTIRTGSATLNRPLLLWFLVSGFATIMLGHLGLWVERNARRPLPLSFGVELFLFGAVLAVVSGGGLPACLFAAGGAYVILVSIAARRKLPETQETA